MPFYEYECTHCKFYAEVMQKITDAPLRKCPSCGRNALKKLVSAPVFRLKGGGWYETDFKSDQESKRNLAAPEKSEGGEAKSGSEPAAAGAGSSGASADGKAAPAKPAPGKSETAKPAAPAAASGRTHSVPRSDARAGARSTARPAARAPAKSAKRPAAPARKARRGR